MAREREAGSGVEPAGVTAAAPPPPARAVASQRQPVTTLQTCFRSSDSPAEAVDVKLASAGRCFTVSKQYRPEKAHL